MIVGVNILLKYLGFFHGMLLIMILNIVATGLFPVLTTLFGFYGAMAARLGLKSLGLNSIYDIMSFCISHE